MAIRSPLLRREQKWRRDQSARFARTLRSPEGVSRAQARACQSFSYGGIDFADVPKPHRRRCEVLGRKRRVEVKIERTYGEAHHWYAKVKEDPDEILCVQSAPDQVGDRLIWVTAWDDEVGRGRTYEEKFTELVDAEGFVAETLRTCFPTRTHVHVVDAGFDANHRRKIKRWVYKREGD